MTPKFNLPKREYYEGPKKMVSMRLPERLMKEIERQSGIKQTSVTELISTVLDQYIQWEKKRER